MGDSSKAVSIDIIIGLIGQGKIEEAKSGLEQLKGQAVKTGEEGAEGAHKMELGHHQLAMIVQRLAGSDFPELGHAISSLAFGGTVVGSIFAVVGLIEIVKNSVDGYLEKLHQIEDAASDAIFLPGIEKKLSILRQVVGAMDDYQRDLANQKESEDSITAKLSEQLGLHAAIRAAQQGQLEAEHTLAAARIEQDAALGNITAVEAVKQKADLDKKFAQDKFNAERDARQQQVNDETAASSAAAGKQKELDDKMVAAQKKVTDEELRQNAIKSQFAVLQDKGDYKANVELAQGKTKAELEDEARKIQEQLTTTSEAANNPLVPNFGAAALAATMQEQLKKANARVAAATARDQYADLQAKTTAISDGGPLKQLGADLTDATNKAKANAKAKEDADTKEAQLIEEGNKVLEIRNNALKAEVAAIDTRVQTELGKMINLGATANTQERGAQQVSLIRAIAEAAVIAAGEKAKKDINEGRVNQSLNPAEFKKDQQAIADENAVPQSEKDLIQHLGDFSAKHQTTMQQAAQIISSLVSTPDSVTAVLKELAAKVAKNDLVARGILDELANHNSQNSFPNRGQ